MKKLMSILILISSIICMNSELAFSQDWPNLERFRTENSKLKTPDTSKNRIVFMGNSITEGWLHEDLNFFDNESYINRGIGGQTTPQMLLRFRQDVINLKPKAVVILAGINDIAENTGPSSIDMIMHNLISMMELSKSNDIEVIICSVLPASNFPWNPEIDPTLKVIQLNEQLKEYSNREDLVYLDYFSEMVNEVNGLKENLTYDGVHPNIEGYKVMEKLAKEAIEKILLRINE